MREGNLSEQEEQSLICHLREVDNEADLTNAFKQVGIADYEEKAYYLHRCSGFDVAFNTPKYRFLTPKEKYVHELKIFVEKLWEVTAFYDNK